jgi:hypothetical protein
MNGQATQAQVRQAQATQAQVNYRMGTPVTKCGNCVYYTIKRFPVQFGRCEKVTGRITTYGLCNLYLSVASPFPQSLTAEEKDQLETWYWDRVKEKGINQPESKNKDFWHNPVNR